MPSRNYGTELDFVMSLIVVVYECSPSFDLETQTWAIVHADIGHRNYAASQNHSNLVINIGLLCKYSAFFHIYYL
jgi:hypothetical protein